ncbi:MAG: hypothetical protein ACO3UU_17580, partial [Minisyncoccia bacterium]
REGKSTGRKQRCYFIPSKNNIYCHNCGWSSTPINWIKEVSGTNFTDIIDELKTFDIDIENYIENDNKPATFTATPDLPRDCINLFDKSQVEFFKDNKVLQKDIKLIKNRNLDIAVNRPKALYLSLNDNIHKNRLVIPFYENGEVIFYQSRTILSNDTKSKYISKINSTKSLYGFDQIDPRLDNVFIFEGPINSFFVKNGVAVAGIQEKSHQSFTAKQIEQLSSLVLYKKIWVLDSQWIDSASLSKSKILADQNETIFIWPEKIGRKYKDFNDLAMKFNIDEISAKFIADNSYKGMGAKIALESIKTI